PLLGGALGTGPHCSAGRAATGIFSSLQTAQRGNTGRKGLRMATALHEDKKLLHSIGYAQELARRMSGFSNFAISFSIICILSGGINSFAHATGPGGGGSTALAG